MICVNGSIGYNGSYQLNLGIGRGSWVQLRRVRADNEFLIFFTGWILGSGGTDP